MIKYKCKRLFHFISSTLLLNNINEEWREMKMNVKNSSQNTVKKYEELTFTKCRCKAPCFSNGDIRRLNQKNV